jgi:hypothetical protein
MRLSYQRGGQLCCRVMRERRVERLSRRRQKRIPALAVRAAQRCKTWLTIPTCRGLVPSPSVLAASPTSGAAPECTEPPVCTLLLSAVHPVTLYTHPAKHRKQGAVWHPISACRWSSHPPPPKLARHPQHCNVNDATLHTTVLVHQ